MIKPGIYIIEPSKPRNIYPWDELDGKYKGFFWPASELPRSGKDVLRRAARSRGLRVELLRAHDEHGTPGFWVHHHPTLGRD